MRGSYVQDYLMLARQAKAAGKKSMALALAGAARAALQEALDAIDGFTTGITDEIGAAERQTISPAKAAGKGTGRKGRAKGWKMSEEAKAKISAAARARKRDKFGHLIAGKKSTKTKTKTRKVSKKASQKKK